MGIGSNLGDRKFFCQRALWALKKLPGVYLIKWSSLYLTPPVGFSSDRYFYNLVAEIKTSLSPWALLFSLWQIELANGRKRTGKVTDRSLDLDILLYEGATFDSKLLSLPHQKLHERSFVLIPLVELLPHEKHPILNKTYEELLAKRPPSEKRAIKILGPLCLE
ncbi:2-amino-4-hydroxy-6-hydroxymethyldihydropteridine pyrophosphokinase [Thermodesulfatator indicus DSM 15286]|uniref:2-amino-4-hydroxy-6-hydroxymethyldihydropteridine pyrophosphokinase n=1 Tax=Thermodesulfatator indicus (strain DSM 15286 / JCM 11887 / CIR29812) TaxID=667014 RepID=F8A8A3_THEID|nr:2-amino-4-hydroxy-6-hydroxymethyldihydropteridine pyrophosphokinase [Thermodesulfatator indicus DSM 15286]